MSGSETLAGFVVSGSRSAFWGLCEKSLPAKLLLKAGFGSERLPRGGFARRVGGG